MKKVAILATAMIMITTPVLASPVDQYAEIHNACRLAAGAAELPAEPEVEGNTYTYKVSDALHVIYIIDGENVTFSCVCLDESSVSEFLAQCVTAVYAIGGLTAYVDCFDPILSDFLSARSGSDTEKNTSIPGILFSIEKMSFGYTFILVRVK